MFKPNEKDPFNFSSFPKSSQKSLPQTTGIGSLPHHNVDSALEFSFRMGIPFLPQIPIRNRWEFLFAQALESFPGLFVEDDGSVFIREKVWEDLGREFSQKVSEAYSSLFQWVSLSQAGAETNHPDSVSSRYPSLSAIQNLLSPFLPSPEASNCWQPFLWELQEKNQKWAKFQIAGPLTTMRSLRIRGEKSLNDFPEIGQVLFQLILLRASAMTFAFTARGIQSILFIDEPALYHVDWTSPQSQMEIRELKLLVETLRTLGSRVGIHCCSQTEWSPLLQLDLDFLSFDTSLSLQTILSIQDGRTVSQFCQRGGRLAFGVIPTSKKADLNSLDLKTQVNELRNLLFRIPDGSRILREALYTPSCGLAYHNAADAELILDSLNVFYELCQS